MPNILEKGIPITRFLVKNDEGISIEAARDGARTAFQKFPMNPDNLKDSTLLENSGWCSPLDILDCGMESFEPLLEDDHVYFGFRRDKKSIPARLVGLEIEARIKQEADDTKMEIDENVLTPLRPPITKRRRREIKEQVVEVLSRQAKPVPLLVDVVWLPSNEIWLLNTSEKIVGQFKALFERTFEGLTLFQLTPALLAGTVDASGLKYLTWLWNNHLELDFGKFDVDFGGKMTLIGKENERASKVTVDGANAHAAEIEKALNIGKDITKAQLRFVEDAQGDDDADKFSLELTAADFTLTNVRVPKFPMDKDIRFDDSAFFIKVGYLQKILRWLDTMYMAYVSRSDCPFQNDDIQDALYQLQKSIGDGSSITIKWASGQTTIFGNSDKKGPESSTTEQVEENAEA